MLEAAKNKFRCFVSTVNPYPNREDGLREAGDCVAEAIADHRANGKKVDPGKMTVIHCSVGKLIPNISSECKGFRRQYKEDMAILVSVSR